MASSITNSVTVSTSSSDQKKMLAAKLIKRAKLRLVANGICDKMRQEEGTGLTATLVRYKRLNLPSATLTEGVSPASEALSLETVTVTLDQWGDVVTITDLAELTTNHPLVQEVTNLLADSAQRVIDRETQLVWLTGTTVQYFDGTVTSRRTLAAGQKISDTVIHKAVVTLVNNGAPARGGPSPDFDKTEADTGSSSINKGLNYVGIASANVIHDIMQNGTSLGTWAATAMYANQEQLYTSEAGTWLNVRWVETNFIPAFTALGTATVLASSTVTVTDVCKVTDNDTGGTLVHATYYGFKVTRKDLTRGFEEAISFGHTLLTGSGSGGVDTHSWTVLFPTKAGFVYNFYMDDGTAGPTSTTAQVDAHMLLVSANNASASTITIGGVQATGGTAPDNVGATTITVYPTYIHGEESCSWVGLQDLQVLVSLRQPTTYDPLLQIRTIGYKFVGKTVIRDQNRMLRLESLSSF